MTVATAANTIAFTPLESPFEFATSAQMNPIGPKQMGKNRMPIAETTYEIVIRASCGGFCGIIITAC